MMNIRNIKSWDTEDFLDLLGLQYKNSSNYVGSAIGFFALGLVVGAGVGMLFAPKDGRSLRQDISNRMSSSYQNARQMVSDVPSKMGISSSSNTSSSTGANVSNSTRSTRSSV